ncbi:MAG: hypothetical protein ACLQGP_15745 [Isosphaeraceae bacterium]
MPDPAAKPPKGSFARLAIHVAAGGKIAPWCREHAIGIRTGYRWSKDPKFLTKVEAHRRRATDRAIGLLAHHAAVAVEGLVRLAKSAKSEPVKLAAQRGVLAELRDMEDHASLSRRLAELERRLDASERSETPEA